MFLEAGGQLIRDASGEIVGAIGVTGDVNEVDDLCAIDGIHAGGFRADADFDAKAAKRLNIKVDPPLRIPARGRAYEGSPSRLPDNRLAPALFWAVIAGSRTSVPGQLWLWPCR